MSLTRRKGTLDTLAITQSLGLQTFRRSLRKAWLKQEDQELMARIEELYPTQYANKTLKATQIQWDLVADIFQGSRKPKDCRKRWITSLNPNLRRGKWTAEEDAILRELYIRFGPLWQKVALQIEGRTEHQCSKRYLEILDPSLRNRLLPWTEEEDLMLIRLVAKHGTKWKTIAEGLLGRPSLTCRNRWRNLVTAVVRGRASPTIVEVMSTVVTGDLGKEIFSEAASGQIKKAAEVKTESDMEDVEMHSEAEESVESSNYRPTPAMRETSWTDKPQLPSIGSPNIGNLPTRNTEPWRFTPEPSESWSRAPPRPVPIESKYNYQISAGRGSDLPEDHPVRAILDNECAIASQALVDYMLRAAAHYNLHISIHQHHHYERPSEELFPPQDLGFDRLSAPQRVFNLEPEAQLNRVQHFNYLPPLTPVPKLTSSASSPQEIPQQHHHHHRRAVKSDLDKESRESSLLKLLNENTDAHKTALRARSPITDENRLDSMTPLTQAVQLATENGGDLAPFFKRGQEFLQEQPKKKTRTDFVDEDGVDFFETIRNLHNGREPMAVYAPTVQTSQKETRPGNAPVSQHHPLHYFTSSMTPRPEDVLDEEDKEFMYDCGLYYMRDKPMEPLEYSDDSNGLFPFNPS